MAVLSAASPAEVQGGIDQADLINPHNSSFGSS